VSYFHKYQYVDKSTVDLMDTFSFVGNFLPAMLKDMIPDFKCGDMGDKMPFSAVAKAIDTAVSRTAASSFFYPDAAAYNPFFAGVSAAHPWNLVDIDTTAFEIETHHFCIDNFKVNGIIELVESFASKMGLPAPAGPISIIKKVNDIINMINFLKITLRFEFVMVVADSDIAALSNAETLAKAAVATIPGYEWSNLKKMDRTTCV
jgi:hypothetical protein